jgi:hypothetical protein
VKRIMGAARLNCAGHYVSDVHCFLHFMVAVQRGQYVSH